jgi:hypothetical protein
MPLVLKLQCDAFVLPEVVMSNKRPSEQIRVKSPFAVQASPFGHAELVNMRNAMASIAPEWLVELQGICSDEATLVLIPDSGDDSIGPSFMISRDTCGLRVDEVHWDILTEVGVFRSLSEVLLTLRARLAFCTGLTAPSSMTVH